MADGQRSEDSAPQWNPSGRQDPSAPHGANGFSSSSSTTTTTSSSSSSSASAYRACQPGATGPFSSARENGFNGVMSGAHPVTAEQVSARIVQEVTAEAVAVLKGEQESLADTAKRLPSVEDTTNLPPSPPPSPAAQHFGPLERDVGDEEEAGPLRRFQNSRERCKFLAPSISVSVPEDEPYHSDEEYYEHPLFSPEWTRSGVRPVQAVPFRQIEEEETMEALTADYEEEVEEEEEEEESTEAAESEAAIEEQQWSGDEPELESPPAEALGQAEAVGEVQAPAQDQVPAVIAVSDSSVDREMEEVEQEEQDEKEEEQEAEALKMESEKQDSEQSESMSPCSIGSDKRAEDSAEPQMQEFFAGERMVPESPTMDMPCFVPASTPNQAKEPTRSMTLQPMYGEPITVSEKQPSVELVEFTTVIEPSEFSPLEVKAHGGDAAMETRDKSGMSTYFETSTVDVDEAPRNRAEGYYELSTVGEENTETDSLTQEISYSTLAQIQELPGTNKGSTEDTRSFLAPDRNNDCKLSPGKLALDQRSYSLNITIGAMDSSGQGKPRNLSPLATDIMSYTSGSLDDTADYLPVTTPSVEKPSPFPPLILETAASVTSDCSSPPQSSGQATISSPQPESPGSPEDSKYSYKNGTVMAPDLPEMLDLGTRSRLASDNTDPEIMPKKSEAPAEVFTGDPMASFVAGQLSHSVSKSDSQIEEMGYCVFSEYSGPMPSPADVLSPIGSSAQAFTPSVLEAKMAEQARKQAVRDTSMDDKNQSIEVVDGDIKLDQNQTGKKDADEEKVEADKVKLDISEIKPETIKPSPPTEAFVTPTVTVTLEEGGRCGSEAEQQHSGDGSVSDTEIADYERQIRKLEMEDRPLSMEEERELQELREKVKLVHQEAYEEVDAEEMYQLTGVAKDHIAKPAKTSPASSVDSVIDDDKLLSPVLSPAKRQVEAYGSPKRVISPVLGTSKDEAERNRREQKEAEKKEKDEVERKMNEEKQKKEEEQRERVVMEEKSKLEAERKLKEEQEIKEREIRKKEEDEKIEKEMKAQREKGDREREEKEKIAKEFEKEKQEREQREKIEKEENDKKEKEEREKKEREEKEKEKAEKEKKEKEEIEKEKAEKVKKEKEEIERKEKEEIEKKEKEEKEKKEKEEIEKEKAEKLKKEKEEGERKEKEEIEKKEVEEKAKREKEEKENNQNIPEPKPATSVGAALGATETVVGVKLGEKDANLTAKDSLEAQEDEDDIEVLDGTGEKAGTSTQACKEIPEPRAAIESVVTVEDDFITVVQTIDEEGEEPGHSVRFSAPPETAVHHVPGAEEEEECVEEAEEAEMEAGSLEEILDVPEAQEIPSSPDKEAKTTETEGRTESYDRDETTIDDSILDSSWIDTQDDDRSMATEMEQLPLAHDAAKTSDLKQEKLQTKQEKAVKTMAKESRAKGRVSTPERKPVRKEPVCIPREEAKKKKAVIKKTELTKKAETRSPARRSTMKPSARQTRPIQHHSCPRRRVTATSTDGRHPFSVARQSLDRVPHQCHTKRLQPTKIPALKSRVVKSLPHLPARPSSASSCKSQLAQDLDRLRPSSAEPLFPLSHRALGKKDGRSCSPEQRASVPRPASILTRHGRHGGHGGHDQEESSTSITSSGSTAPRRPTSFRTEMKAEHRLGRASSMSGLALVRSRSARSGHSTPRGGGSAAVTPGTPPSCPSSSRHPATPRSLSLISQERRAVTVAVVRTPPKSPATTPKQLRILNQPLPDFKNVKSKIGSTENIKYQPKGGQKCRGPNLPTMAKRGASWIWKSVLRVVTVTLYLSAAHSVTWTKDPLMQILNKKLDFSRVQSKCGSRDNLKYTPRGGNVQIQNKKIDLSHVTSKCGSLDNIHHRPGGGNIRIESVRLDFKDKAQAKVGSLDNAGQPIGRGPFLIESHKVMFQAKPRDPGADIVVTSQSEGEGAEGGSPGGRLLSSSGSLDMLESPQLATLAEDVTAALAKQGL
ncbi:microtubule-associated protein 2 isoform X3 [Gadus macrocephalus]|uniref:microtubule-associated protein 2 isoform X3 n=1 Tax=Gadus macrocephalus TaxID=80720 RepID=UPI0028CB6827|nr:microtubule-associated protein 2 isoform X3 [Gadus macrocephalus]